MKKVLAGIVGLVLMLGTLGGLSGCQQPGDDADVAKDDEITISLLVHGQQLGSKYKYRQEAKDAINEKLFRDLGFKVNIVATSYVDQFDTMLSLDIAAGINYDMVRATTDMAATYMRNGSLHDLKPLIDQHAPHIKAAVPASLFAENTISGKIAGIPTCSFPVQYGMWFRGDWLETIGKAVPASLAELEAVMQAMLDNSAVNKDKIIPMAGSRDFMEMVFLGMFTEHPGDYVDENGKVQPKYLDPGYRQFVEKIASWYQKGYVNDLLINGDENAINELISKDKVGIHVGNAYQLEYTPLKSYNEQKNLKMTWSLPFKADTKKYYSPGAGNDIIMIPVTSQVSEYVIKFYDWYYDTKENADLVMYGIQDKTYTTSVDEATQKPIIGIPDSEKTDTILQPSDLIGLFGTNVHASLQLYYTSLSRPAESARAYDSCNTDEVMQNFNLDITKQFRIDFPGTLETKFQDAREMMLARVSEMMIGKRASTDAEWASLKAEFERLGGREAYDYQTTEYNKAKGQ